MVSEPVQISCIVRDDRFEPHARITHIGGCRETGRWQISQQEAIEYIENHDFSFWVRVGARSVWVVVGESSSGTKYLRTEADSTAPHDLLGLPDCPRAGPPARPARPFASHARKSDAFVFLVAHR